MMILKKALLVLNQINRNNNSLFLEKLIRIKTQLNKIKDVAFRKIKYFWKNCNLKILNSLTKMK
jgi:hypothetical protein